MTRKNQRRKKTVVFAPHDDGGGAFGVLCRLARAMAKVASDSGQPVRMVFFNSRVDPKTAQKRLNRLAAGTGCSAHFVVAGNLMTIPKDPTVGSVRAAGIPTVLRQALPRLSEWPRDRDGNSARLRGRPISHAWWQKVDLSISMGVPWVHRLAQQAGRPSVEVGDMCFSVVLRGCLKEAGLVSPFAERALNVIADYELMAGETWLVPFMAPREYEDHYASAGVPVDWLPGVLWTGDPPPPDIESWRDAERVRTALREDLQSKPIGRATDVKIVCIEGGRTGVWAGLIGQLRQRERQEARAPAIIVREALKVELLEGKGIPLTKVSGRMAAVAEGQIEEAATMGLRTAVDLGITRSGGGALAYLEGRAPVAVADEPFHWLGRRQREMLSVAGLCVPIQLGGLRQDPDATVKYLLEDRRKDLEGVQDRSYALRPGAEIDLASYLFRRYLTGL